MNLANVIPADTEARVYGLGLIAVLILAVWLVVLLVQADRDIKAARRVASTWRMRALVLGYRPEQEPRRLRPAEHHTIVVNKPWPGAR